LFTFHFRRTMAISAEERAMPSSSVLDCRDLRSSKPPLHVNVNCETSSASFVCICAACDGENRPPVERNENVTSIGRNCGTKQSTDTYTICQVRRHCTAASAWLVAGDSIFDATEYMAQHPGGIDAILRKAGGVVDCTEDLQFHSRRGRNMWQKCMVGKLVPCATSQGVASIRPWWQLW
jgi:cytochrome b involved in lipid metabolism